MSGASAAIERAYPTRDNEIAFQLLADGVAIDGAAVTRTLLRLIPEAGGITLEVDSDVMPGVFDWSRGTGIVEITLRAAPDVPAGRYTARLVVYDADHTNGLVWGRAFTLIYDLA